VFLAQVDHQHALRNVHLRRGETDTGRGVHRLEHVVDQSPQRRVDLRDGLRTGAQSRVGKFQNLKLCHGGKSGDSHN
jgi:hypothetical protein